jgi:hypothetical protein
MSTLALLIRLMNASPSLEHVIADEHEGPDTAEMARLEQATQETRRKLVMLDCEIHPSECTVNYYGRSE